MRAYRIRENTWGNWKGYCGTRCLKEFGTDERAAQDWLKDRQAMRMRLLDGTNKLDEHAKACFDALCENVFYDAPELDALRTHKALHIIREQIREALKS